MAIRRALPRCAGGWPATALAAYVVAFLLTACALPGAPALTVLSTLSERQSRAVIDAFQRDTGIRTLYVRSASNEALHRLEIERGRPFFSVWWGGEIADVRAAAEAGWLEPYLPPAAQVLPPELRDAQDRWYAVYLDPVALAANRSWLAGRGLALPRGWAEALQPAYHEALLLPHPTVTEAGYWTLATLAQLPGGEAGAFAALRRSAPRYSRSGLLAAADTAAGQAGLTAGFASDLLAYAATSPDFTPIFPEEGTGYTLRAAALVRGAKQPAEAKRFLDWALGPSATAATRTAPEYLLPALPEHRADVPQFSGLRLLPFD